VGTLATALAVAACGSSKPPPEPTMPVEGPGAPKGAASPRQAIIDYFEAKRSGNTELGCSLESEDFQKAQYNGTGRACLNRAQNMEPQLVWREKVLIDKLDVAHDSAAARIRPTSGSNTPAEITLVRGKGGWLVNSLR
jgi:hypothetical protein